MKISPVFILLAPLISIVIARSHKKNDFKYETILDHDNRVRLQWNVDKESKQIQFKLELIDFRLPLIIGFGASDRGQFENADLVVFELFANSSLNYLDCYTDAKGVLRVDPGSNYDYTFENFRVLNSLLEIIIFKILISYSLE